MDVCWNCKKPEISIWYVQGVFEWPNNLKIVSFCSNCERNRENYHKTLPKYCFKTKEEAEIAVMEAKLFGDQNEPQTNESQDQTPAH